MNSLNLIAGFTGAMVLLLMFIAWVLWELKFYIFSLSSMVSYIASSVLEDRLGDRDDLPDGMADFAEWLEQEVKQEKEHLKED